MLRSLSSITSCFRAGLSIERTMATWRDNLYMGEAHWKTIYPNFSHHLTHHRHFRPPHTIGVQKMSRLRVVDNSKLGREAMAEGKPPKIIQVYNKKYGRRPHGAYGTLGDRVLLAIKGQKKQGIIVGLKANQLPGVPRFDTNNVVLIEENGNPSGTRITAPIPHCIRPILARKSHPKKADYTKLFAVATSFV